MKPKYLTPILILVALGAAFSAQAHDPKEHMKDAKKPDCAAMKNMDHSKMNMNDPVMQAMMKKCMKDMQHNESKTDQTQADHQANEGSSGELQSKHQH
ncbi:MAG: hypothetical protein GYB33_07900 [Gammaproteobacteria bacterium]|nr:hypothetical protein [Gammaproteobacteria bacterium]